MSRIRFFLLVSCLLVVSQGLGCSDDSGGSTKDAGEHNDAGKTSHDSGTTKDGSAGTGGSEHDAATDSGAKDAAIDSGNDQEDSGSNPSTDSGTQTDTGVVDAGVDAGHGTDTPACMTCEAAQATTCAPRREACLEATGTAVAGPMAGANRSDLCQAVLDCVRTTGCGVVDIQTGKRDFAPCLCETQAGACVDNPAGACKDEIIAASETSSIVDTAARLVDPQFSVGLAIRLLQCDDKFCESSCQLCAAGSQDCADAP